MAEASGSCGSMLESESLICFFFVVYFFPLINAFKSPPPQGSYFSFFFCFICWPTHLSFIHSNITKTIIMVFPLKFPLKSLIPHTPNDEERMAAEMIMKEAFEARLSAERHGVMGYLDSYRREPQTRGKPDSKFLQNVISHTLAHNKTVSTEPPWHRHHKSSKYKERDKRRKRRSEDMHPRSEGSSSSSRRRSPKRSRREEVIDQHEKEGNLDSSDREGNYREPKHDGKDDVGEGSDEEVEGGGEQDGKDNIAVGPTRSMLPPENRKVRGRGAFAYLMGNARMDALFAQPSDDEEGEEAKKEWASRCNSGAVASQMMKKRELSTDEESSSSSSSSEEERKRKRRKEKKKKKKERKKKKRKEEEKKKKKKRRKKEREDAKKQKLQT